jgi:hypothetical protein
MEFQPSSASRSPGADGNAEPNMCQELMGDWVEAELCLTDPARRSSAANTTSRRIHLDRMR